MKKPPDYRFNLILINPSFAHGGTPPQYAVYSMQMDHIMESTSGARSAPKPNIEFKLLHNIRSYNCD